MYKKILVPTDGTKLSQRAVEHAIALAHATGAAVVVLHAYPKFLGSPYGTVGPAAEVLAEAHERQARAEHKRLAEEIFDAFNNQGAAVTKKDNVHKMAEANSAYSHFAW